MIKLTVLLIYVRNLFNNINQIYNLYYVTLYIYMLKPFIFCDTFINNKNKL